MGRPGQLSLRARAHGALDPDGAIAALDDDGRPLQVVGALPDEQVEVVVTHVSGRGRRFARVERVIEASPDRVPAACPHFLRCGGCALLHVAPREALALKHARVTAALGAPVEPVTPAPAATGYRGLAKLVVGPGGELGSFAAYSHTVVDMAGCRVHAPVLEAIAADVRGVLAVDTALRRELRYLILRAATTEPAGTRRVVVTLVTWALDAPASRALGSRLAERADVARIVLHANDSSGDALLGDGPEEVLFHARWPAETLGGISQSLESGAFTQVNPAMAAQIYGRIHELAAPTLSREPRFLDLYAGSGGVALTLLRGTEASGVAVERSEAACQAAERAAAGLGDRVQFEARAVEAYLREASALPGLVVVNPPRKGLGSEVVARLVALGLRELIYLSCSPESLARDLEGLRPFTRLWAEPFDLFPGTSHVETLVRLRR